MFIALGLSLAACFDTGDCINLKNNLIGISFKKIADGQADTVNIAGISVDGSDSTFSAFTAATGVTLALNPAEGQQVFNFNLATGNFMLTTSYINQTQFEDEECGPRFLMSGLAVPQHTFDSVRVINPIPQQDPGATHIEVFRCPITNGVKLGFRQLLADDNSNGIALQENINGIAIDFLPFTFFPNVEASAVVLPLNVNAGATEFIIDTQNHGTASLLLNYVVGAKTLFTACGEQPFIGQLQVASSDFDGVSILNDSIFDPPTTNILLLRCPDTNLIQMQLKSADGSEATEFLIKQVTTGFSSDIFFKDQTTSSLILPLDASQDQTDFLIEFENGARQLRLGYQRTVQVFHGQCTQTLFSSLEVVSSDFATEPLVVSDSIQFPTVINLEIFNN